VPPAVTVVGFVNAPGSVPISLNAGNSFTQIQSANLTAWGTYTFEIEVQKFDSSLVNDPFHPAASAPVIDTLTLRSPNLSMSSHGAQIALNAPQQLINFGYQLADATGNAASAGTVSLLSPTLSSVTSVDFSDFGGTAIGTQYGPENLYTVGATDPAGTYIVLFEATDSDAVLYRDYQPRQMLAVNMRPQVPFVRQRWGAVGDWWGGEANFPPPGSAAWDAAWGLAPTRAGPASALFDFDKTVVGGPGAAACPRRPHPNAPSAAVPVTDVSCEEVKQ
jgi:hypothetical protein